jgi:lysophospholipase L1-like esterase
MIGINDLHRTLDGIFVIPPSVYRERYERILQRAAGALSPELVLLEPFYMILERDANDYQRRVLGVLPGYIEAVHELASKFGARLVRLQDMFEAQLHHRPYTTFCAEPVHPNRTGHMLIAWELLATLEA